MHTMTKSTFTIKTDNKTGLKYVSQAKDQLPKNHSEQDKDHVSGVMPNQLGECIKIKEEVVSFDNQKNKKINQNVNRNC